MLPATDASELPHDAVHQLDALVEDLESAGFDPTVDESGLTVELSPCAHATTQAAHREMLCTVHLSLMQSVLSEAGGPLAIQSIRPSCDPTQCVVQLTKD
jgi:predicted ArsR family transcriptional regulator